VTEPRYVIRPAESSTHREWEIFDNHQHETIGSFKKRGKKDSGDVVMAGYAEELAKRLNAEHELCVAAVAARHQIWQTIVALPDEEALKKFGDLERGRSVYLPTLDKTAETTP
jgi:hypothetical protein